MTDLSSRKIRNRILLNVFLLLFIFSAALSSFLIYEFYDHLKTDSLKNGLREKENHLRIINEKIFNFTGLPGRLPAEP